MTADESAYFLKTNGHEDLFRHATIANHSPNPANLHNLGTLSAGTVRELSNGLLTEENFKEFTFSNAVHLYGDGNPDFFTGTAVESQVAELRAQSEG